MDFNLLLNAIWRRITTHSHHQQWYENYVQMAAMIAKTLVGGARRKQRAIAGLAIIRCFNLEAVTIRKELVMDQKKRNKMKRVSGCHQIELFSDFSNKVSKQIEDVREHIEDDRYDKLVDGLANTNIKTSVAEWKDLETGFENSVKKKKEKKT